MQRLPQLVLASRQVVFSQCARYGLGAQSWSVQRRFMAAGTSDKSGDYESKLKRQDVRKDTKYDNVDADFAVAADQATESMRASARRGYDDAREATERLAAGAEHANSLGARMQNKAKESASDLLASVGDKASRVGEVVKDKMAAAASKVVETAKEKGHDVAELAREKAHDVAVAAKSKAASAGVKVKEKAADVAASAMHKAADVTGSMKEKAASMASDMDTAALKNKAVDVASSVKEKTVELASSIKEKAVDMAGGMKDKAADVAGGMKDKAADMAGGMKDKTADVASDMKSTARGMAAGMKDTAEDVSSGVKSKATHLKHEMFDSRSGNMEGVKQSASHMADVASDMTSDMKDKVMDTARGMKDKASDMAGGMKDKMHGSGGGLVDKVADLAGNLKDKAADVARTVKEKLASVPAGDRMVGALGATPQQARRYQNADEDGAAQHTTMEELKDFAHVAADKVREGLHYTAENLREEVAAARHDPNVRYSQAEILSKAYAEEKAKREKQADFDQKAASDRPFWLGSGGFGEQGDLAANMNETDEASAAPLRPDLEERAGRPKDMPRRGAGDKHRYFSTDVERVRPRKNQDLGAAQALHAEQDSVMDESGFPEEAQEVKSAMHTAGQEFKEGGTRGVIGQQEVSDVLEGKYEAMNEYYTPEGEQFANQAVEKMGNLRHMPVLASPGRSDRHGDHAPASGMIRDRSLAQVSGAAGPFEQGDERLAFSAFRPYVVLDGTEHEVPPMREL